MSTASNRHRQFSSNRSTQHHDSRQLYISSKPIKVFFDEMFLYRDTDSFRNSCVAMC